MDITRAFTFVFEDDDWVGKVVMIMVWAFISIIPLVGLVGWAALAGYVVQMLRNMRRGDENPLPTWDNLGAKITDGANVLIAAFVYNLGNMLVACGLVLLMPAMGMMDNGDAAFASTASLVISCCLGIVLLIYNLVVWPLLAVGTIHYSQTGQIGSFFQLGHIYGTINRNASATGQWIIFSIFAGFILGLINAIPCIGWLVGLGLTVPINGHLLGQYALRLQDKPKGKPKARPVEVRR